MTTLRNKLVASHVIVVLLITLAVGCTQQQKQYYKLAYIDSPHTIAAGDRIDYGLLIQTSTQPTFDTLLLFYETPSTSLTMPDGNHIDLLAENIDGSLGGLEAVFRKRYVKQESDGTVWLYGFERSDSIYWIYQDNDNRYGVPYGPRSNLDWDREKTYNASLRRCPLLQASNCENIGSFDMKQMYVGIETIDTALAVFETYHFSYDVRIRIFDASDIDKHFYNESYVYPGVGEVKYWITLLEINSTTIIGEAGATNIPLPTIPENSK